MSPPAIVLRKVVKRSGKRVVIDDLNATIPAGELVAIVGPRGAGKTMLLRLIAGLAQPDAGTLEVLGHDPRTNVPAIQAKTGYMPQLPGLSAHLTTIESLQLHADLRDLSGALRATRIAEVLQQTGLTELASIRTDALPHAARQKLGFACALVGAPQLLLLDEPGAGLDPISRRQIFELARDRTSQGATVLWSTSSFDETERCGHAILLDRGRIVAQGLSADIGERLVGRVHEISAIGPGRRRIAAQLRAVPGVAVTQIESSAVRFLTEQPLEPDGRKQIDGIGSSRPAVPRLADAFVDPACLLPADTLATTRLSTTAEVSGTAIEAPGLDLTVGYGEVVGLVGPAGSGKTTTLQRICGLLAPSAGGARIAGVNVRRAPTDFRLRFGYMGQGLSLYRDLSGVENLDFFAAACRVPRLQRRDRVNRLLSDFVLMEVAHLRAGELEPGAQQRLGLAATLIHDPAIVLVDEPTAGIDQWSRRLIWDRLGSIADRGGAVLVATRSATEAEQCDRLTLLDHGNAIATGRPEELASQQRERAA